MYVLTHVESGQNAVPPLTVDTLAEATNEAVKRTRLVDYPRTGRLQIHRTEDGKMLREWERDGYGVWRVLA